MAMKSCAASTKAFPVHKRVPFMLCSEDYAKKAIPSNIRERLQADRLENTIALQEKGQKSGMVYLINGGASAMPFPHWA